MGRKCEANFCENYQDKIPKKTFFGFPKELERCKKWVGFCRSSEIDKLFIKNGTSGLRCRKICSDHFDSNDFVNKMRPDQGLRKTAVPSRKEVLRSIVDVSTATKPAGHEVDGLVKEYGSRVSIAPNVPAVQVDSEQDDEMVEEYLPYVAVAVNERAEEVDLVEDKVNGEYLAYEQADQVDLEENEMDEEYLAYVPVAANERAEQVNLEEDDEIFEKYLARIPTAANKPNELEYLGRVPIVANEPEDQVGFEDDEMVEYVAYVPIAADLSAGQVVSDQDDGMVEKYLPYVAVAVNERAEEVDLVEDEVNGEYMAYEQADQVDLEENEMDEEYLAYVPVAANERAEQVNLEEDDEIVEKYLARIPTAANKPNELEYLERVPIAANEPEDQVDFVDDEMVEYVAYVPIAADLSAGQVVSEQDDGMVEEYLAYVPIATNEQADQVDLEEAEMDGEYLAYVQIATNVPAGLVDSEQDELVEEFLPRIPNAASGPVVQVVHEEEDIETTYYELECLADGPIDIELGGLPTVVNGSQIAQQHERCQSTQQGNLAK